MDNAGTMTLLKPFEICALGISNNLLKISEILRMLCKLVGTDSNELLGRRQISSLENIKRKQGVNTMNHIIRRIPSQFMNSNLLSPKYLWEHLIPL